MNKSENTWDAAFVKTGDEDNVKIRLQYRFNDEIEFYVPQKKVKGKMGCGMKGIIFYFLAMY